MAVLILGKSCQRQFSTAPRAAAGFRSWFNLLNPANRQKKAQLQQELVNVEAKNKEADELLNSRKAPVVPSVSTDVTIDASKLEVFGLPQQLTKEQVRERLGDFYVKRWLNSHKKITTTEELDDVILKSWGEVTEVYQDSIGSILNTDLSDLSTRFQFLKKVQQHSGHPVSDLILTQATSILFIRDHYLKNILSKENLNYKENLPDALLLDLDSFKDLPNVVIQKTIKRKDIKKKYNKLLQEAKAYKESQMKEAFGS